MNTEERVIYKQAIKNFDTVIAQDRELLYKYIIYRAIRNVWDGRESLIIFHNPGAWLDLEKANKIYQIAYSVLECFLQKGRASFKTFMKMEPYFQEIIPGKWVNTFVHNTGKFSILPGYDTKFKNPENKDLFILNLTDFVDINFNNAKELNTILWSFWTDVFNLETLSENKGFTIGYLNKRSEYKDSGLINEDVYRMSNTVVHVTKDGIEILKDRRDDYQI